MQPPWRSILPDCTAHPLPQPRRTAVEVDGGQRERPAVGPAWVGGGGPEERDNTGNLEAEDRGGEVLQRRSLISK